MIVDDPAGLGSKHPSLRDRQRAERERLILAEAERLLGTEGYDGLVMERLAELVGISKGTLYLHFARKEDLVAAIMLGGLARADQQLTLLVADSTRRATERLGAVLAMLIEHDPAWMSTITGPKKHELSAALAEHPGLLDTYTRFFDALCALIRQGHMSGEFDAAITAPVAAQFLLSVARAQSRPIQPMQQTTVSREEFAALAVRFYFNGLCVHRAT